jgi:hypothetical protein
MLKERVRTWRLEDETEVIGFICGFEGDDIVILGTL